MIQFGKKRGYFLEIDLIPDYLSRGEKGSSKLSAQRMSMQQFHQRWCDGGVHTAYPRVCMLPGISHADHTGRMIMIEEVRHYNLWQIFSAVEKYRNTVEKYRNTVEKYKY